MVDISEELNTIDTKRYGVDIRFPIYSALEKIANYYNYGIGEVSEEEDSDGN